MPASQNGRLFPDAAQKPESFRLSPPALPPATYCTTDTCDHPESVITSRPERSDESAKATGSTLLSTLTSVYVPFRLGPGPVPESESQAASVKRARARSGLRIRRGLRGVEPEP